MWQCVKCKQYSVNPEMFAKHLVENPDCAKANVNQPIFGWQDVEISGYPKSRIGEILWKKEE